MPSYPGQQTVTLRPDLVGSLEKFDLQADQAGFVAQRIFPVKEVPKPFGRFGVRGIEDLLQTHDTTRASGAGYNRGGGGKSKPDITYNTKDNGFEELVDDRENAMYEDYFDAELDATRRTRDAVLRNYESRVCALATGNAITNSNAAAAAWNTNGATPVDDVRAGVLAIFNRTGMKPNQLVIPWVRLQFLKDCPQIIDRLKYNGIVDVRRGNITAQMLTTVFDIEEVVIAGSQVNTANEGQAGVLGNIWSASVALLQRVARTDDHREPTVGRTFHWAEDGSQIGGVVETYRDESRRSNVVRARMETDEVFVYQELGQRITGI